MKALREDDCTAMRLELEFVLRELAELESTASHLRRRIAALLAEQPGSNQSNIVQELSSELAEPSVLITNPSSSEREASFENTTLTLVIVSTKTALEAEHPDADQLGIDQEFAPEAVEPLALAENPSTVEREPLFENTTITLMIISKAAAIEAVAAPATDATEVANSPDLFEEPAPNSEEADLGKVLLFPLTTELLPKAPVVAVSASDIPPQPVERIKTTARLGTAAAALVGLCLLGLHFEFREVIAAVSSSPAVAEMLKPIAGPLPR